MKKQLISLLTVGMVALSAAAANAFGIEGVIFGDYTSASSSYKTQAQLDALNGFHYTRAYLTLKDKISDEVSVRLTLDQNNLTVPIAASGAATAIKANNVFVKYAYADLKLADFSTLQAGLGKTPWIDFEESLWTYRYVSPVFVDLNKAQTSADLGVSLNGRLFDDVMGYQLGMYNGEGYQNTPNGNGSAFGGRLDFKMGNFGLAGFYWSETNRANGNGTAIIGYNPTRTIGMLYYKDDMVTLAGQYLSASDALTTQTFSNGTGYSFWGHTKFPGLEALRLMVRYDSIRPKDTMTVDATTLIYGLSYKVARTTEVGLFGTSVNNSANVANQTDSKFSVNLLTGF